MKIVVKGKIKVPSGVNAKAACTGTVFLTIKKGKKLLTARNAKLSKTCAFTKTISLSKSKVGSAKKLAITVRFQGNTILKPVTKNLSADASSTRLLRTISPPGQGHAGRLVRS